MKKVITITILILCLTILTKLEKVDALELTQDVTFKGSSTITQSGNEFSEDLGYYRTTFTSGTSVQYKSIVIDQDNMVDTTSSDYITFTILATSPMTITSTDTDEQSVCDGWTCTDYDYGELGSTCNEWTCNSYVSPTGTTTTDIYTSTIGNYGLNVKAYDGRVWRSCTIKGNELTCPIFKGQLQQIRVYTTFETLKSTSFKVSISRQFVMYAINDVTSAIEEQTEQQAEQHEELMETNQTYTNEASEEINGTTEVNDYSTAEESLMNSLDFSGIEDLNITINPNASAFIWNIAERLRNINPAIILLMTSMLGMGIIKMILNR